MSMRLQTQMKAVPSPSFTPTQTRLSQRNCVSDECAERRKKQMTLQRSCINQPESSGVPPIVHKVLRSPGQPLDTVTRAFFEPRFGHDFSGVRVHTDAKAAESARAVNALAYTVGRNVVFGMGQYPPETSGGQRLLVHELTHVIQQRFETSGIHNPLEVADPHVSSEQEAERLTEMVLESGSVRPQQHAPAHLARWAIKGDTAKVDSEEDRLGQLPGQVKSSALNWMCIKPVFMKTTSNPTPPVDFEAHYERYLQIGDIFDISNLKTTYKGTSLKLSLFGKTEDNHIVLSTLYPGVNTSKDPDQDIKATAQEGKTPIADFLIGGHQSGGAMFGASGRFEPGKFSADEPAPAFSRATDSKFPRRCWFTHFGTARSVGCSSESFGKSFASVYLRKGAGIDTTTRMIAPACTSKFMKPDGFCESIDAIEFLPASGEAKTADHGPFKLSEPDKFHSSPFWSRIAGTL